MSRLAAILAVSMLVAGCGSGGGGGTSTPSTTTAAPPANDDPVSVAQTYVDALGSGDYATDCLVISKNTTLQVTQNGKVDCAKQFGKVMVAANDAGGFFKGAKVSKPVIKGNNATVTVTSAKGKTVQLPLVRENGQWKVST